MENSLNNVEALVKKAKKIAEENGVSIGTVFEAVELESKLDMRIKLVESMQSLKDLVLNIVVQGGNPPEGKEEFL